MKIRTAREMFTHPSKIIPAQKAANNLLDDNVATLVPKWALTRDMSLAGDDGKTEIMNLRHDKHGRSHMRYAVHDNRRRFIQQMANVEQPDGSHLTQDQVIDRAIDLLITCMLD